MEKFLDREISALEFNARVLAEGTDGANPLMERLKFIGIVSSNMDEFFMVRVASLKAAGESLDAVRARVNSLLQIRNDYFLKTLLPEMEAAGFARHQLDTCTPAQRDYAVKYFEKEVLPVLTPLALTTERPMPVLANLRIYLALTLMESANRKSRRFAVVEIPQKGFPRFIFLPTDKGYPFILMEDLVQSFAADLFPGYEIAEKGFFRITRGAELTLDEEKDEDFMRVMAEALRERMTGDIVRLEVSQQAEWSKFLVQELKVQADALVVNPAWLDLKSASQIAFQTGFDALNRPSWEPRVVPDMEQADDIWALLRRKNVLVTTPYESFDEVTRFLDTAAADPDVLAIKQTLYRTDHDSPVLRALERAAEKGKRVTALIELKARFDEENNIGWAKRLVRAGANVLYGVAGYKTHAKACLVIRREPEGVRRYVHLATGNYNSRTSRVYSDIGFFSSDDALTGDVSAFFNMITGYSQPIAWKKIEVAPFGLRQKLLRLIRRETMQHKAASPGIIRAKMNSLADPELIEALYKASAAGVQIHLNVRGICRLRPGVKGLSENIQVMSIVDQFLEHSRIFQFGNNGENDIFLSSADWMPRNLDRRLELLFPIDDAHNKKRLQDMLDVYFKDNVKAWTLGSDGRYTRVDNTGKKKLRAQEHFMQKAIDEEKNVRKRLPMELKPQKPQPE